VATPRGRRAQRHNQRSDLAARVLVALPAATLAIVLVAAGGPLFAVGMAAFGMLCMHELYAMFHYASPSRLAGFLALIGLIVAASDGTTETLLLVLMASVPATFLLILLQPRGGAPGIAVTQLGIVWIALPFAFAVLLRDLPHGGAIVFAVLLGTFLGDTGAYLGGRAFGRTKLAPTISPNKTVEGLLCGMATAVVAVWWAGLSQDWLGGTKGALLGLGVAIAAPLGDLFESYLKRDAGTKDTGRAFGAHGGGLDRLDAVLFTIVVGYWIWRAML
jgi:phosphatidate cytidylyltransferase